MTKINKRKCKVCGETKNRIFDGKFNAKDKRWRDDDNLLWNGNTCGKCNQSRAKATMKKVRNAKKN